MFDQVFPPHSKWQAYDPTVVPTFPAPSQFLGLSVAGCSGNQNYCNFCDPQFDAVVRAASAAQAADLPTATALWASADRQFTDQAAAVNLVTPSTTDFVSRRVGNYLYNAQVGVLLDQLRVRYHHLAAQTRFRVSATFGYGRSEDHQMSGKPASAHERFGESRALDRTSPMTTQGSLGSDRARANPKAGARRSPHGGAELARPKLKRSVLLLDPAHARAARWCDAWRWRLTTRFAFQIR